MQVVNGVAYFYYNINDNFKILSSIILIFFHSPTEYIYKHYHTEYPGEILKERAE